MDQNRGRLPQFWDCVVDEIKPRKEGISSCWLWIGPHNQLGYGMFSTVLAHSAAAAIYCVEPPSKVYNRCGNKLCMRQEHLSISLLKDREQRFSRVTGKPLAFPITCDTEVVQRILDCRNVDHSNPNYRKIKRQYSTMRRMCSVSGCSEKTIRKVLMKAPIYDLISEIKALTEYQTKPTKAVGSLCTHDLLRYDLAKQVSLILSNEPE